MKELLIIQEKLNAPKSLRNNFGNYNYRSAETILEAVKPLLKETECILKLTDELVNIGDRYYIKAIAILKNKEGVSEEAIGYAREEEIKKGMDGSQITGASSSYARKYALNGLFAIDDGKDSDATNEHGKDSETGTEEDNKPWFNDENYDKISDLVSQGQVFTMKEVRLKYKVSKANAEKLNKLGIK